jgi:hypothetical protein
MKARTVIYADEGKILTNGEVYGKQIFLAEGVSEDSFYEITEEEYEKKMQAEEIVGENV